jgi:transcriptional regulator with XRE-family HTH domain
VAPVATQTKPKPNQTLARLARELKRRRITQLAVAAEAKVSPAHVCNVLAGRDKSSDVLDAAKRLLAEPAEAKAS